MKIIGKSIYQFNSGVSGPRLMVLGGVHGNEMTGIRVVNELIESLSSGERVLKSGSVILALGNLRAIEKNSRGSVPHADMNRVFFKEKLENPSGYEEFRASELAPFMASSDFLIDIHSTNKPSKPFAVAKDANPIRIALAGHFPTDEFLISPPEIIDGTTDVWVTKNGGLGLGYESGIATDASKVPETISGVDGIMGYLDITQKDGVSKMKGALRISRLEEVLLMPEEGFEFAKGRGEGSFETFQKGEILGFSGEKEIRASHDGMLMFPKLKEHQKPGKPVGFLATYK